MLNDDGSVCRDNVAVPLNAAHIWFTCTRIVVDVYLFSFFYSVLCPCLSLAHPILGNITEAATTTPYQH